MKYAEGCQCPSCGSTDSAVIDIRYRPSLKREGDDQCLGDLGGGKGGDPEG